MRAADKMRNMENPSPADLTARDSELPQSFLRVVAVMHRLRAPGGCPWDREQTFQSLRRFSLEEAYEVVDAVEREDWAALKDELGDLLLQVLFYAEMAQEADLFGLLDVIDTLNEKLVRRHPHVFAQERAENAEQVVANWEAIKREERAAKDQGAPTPLLDAVPRAMPALMEAGKLGSKAATVGFDWPEAAPVVDKLREEIAELEQAMALPDAAARSHAVEEELGDLLFTAASLARHCKLQPELVLRAANQKFRRRFGALEAMAQSPIASLSAAELDRLWTRVKAEEQSSQA
jgi:ATP diphosphatase